MPPANGAEPHIPARQATCHRTRNSNRCSGTTQPGGASLLLTFSVQCRSNRVMPKVHVLALALCTTVACASNPRPVFLDRTSPPPEARTVVQVVNRVTFGPRPGDVARVQAMGLRAYLEEQLHPERIADEAPPSSLTSLTALHLTAREFATAYYQPMVKA